MAMTTPAEITNEIRLFSDNLVLGAAPEWVPFDPLNAGIVDECYDNVAAVVRNRGGRALLGWTIWEWPGVVLEAISHAVWEHPDGALLDPTPKVDGEQTTVFVPDRNATDDGRVTLPRHWPLSNWPEIAEYVDVCQQIGETQRQYSQQVPYDVWETLQSTKQTLAKAITRRQAREQVQKEMLNGLALSEPEAASRFSASAADVEASIALARHLASRGDFDSAFRTLITTAELDMRRAFEVRETFLQLLDVCENQKMANDFRGQLAMWLNP